MAIFTSIGLALGASAAAATAVGISAVGLGVTAASAYGQYEAGKQQTSALRQQTTATQEGIAAQSRRAQVDAQRARIAQVREARIRRAQVISSAGQTGLGFASSGVVGATSSISSQEGSNIGLINQTQTFADQASAASQRAADFGQQATEAGLRGQQWQTINTIFGAKESDFTTIFKKTQS